MFSSAIFTFCNIFHCPRASLFNCSSGSSSRSAQICRSISSCSTTFSSCSLSSTSGETPPVDAHFRVIPPVFPKRTSPSLRSPIPSSSPITLYRVALLSRKPPVSLGKYRCSQPLISLKALLRWSVSSLVWPSGGRWGGQGARQAIGDRPPPLRESVMRRLRHRCLSRVVPSLSTWTPRWHRYVVRHFFRKMADKFNSGTVKAPSVANETRRPNHSGRPSG